MRKVLCTDKPIEEWPLRGRPGDNFIHPRYHDALMLGATVAGNGIALNPIGDPSLWPAKQIVKTPCGELTVELVQEDGETVLRFSTERASPVTVRYRGQTIETDSHGACALSAINAISAG